MKNEAEIIWWKTVKQDVETTPSGFTEAAARVGGEQARWTMEVFLSAVAPYQQLLSTRFIKLASRASTDQIFRIFLFL